MRKQLLKTSNIGSRQRKRFSPLALVSIAVTLVVALVGATIFLVLPRLGSHAAQLNADCTLIVPPNPLTAEGLATPYQLAATDPAKGPCNEANAGQAAFVQAAVIDPASGNIAVYNPLVIDQGTQPAAAPVLPKLPTGAVVGIWFGSNGNTLTLQGSLTDGHCVNGISSSIFGQFSYCNADAFFQAANAAIQAGNLKPPALGKAKDGLPCPTTHDFSIVDQDQSDNVTTTYLVTASGQVAQNTKANAAVLQGQVQKNGSDERLLTLVDRVLGCTPWMAPDLADPGQPVTALPLNELQAAAKQADPVALVPAGDPMVLMDNNPNLDKLNAYRVGVDQSTVQALNMASIGLYCTNLRAIAPQRLRLDSRFTRLQHSPDPAVANTLFTFLAQRFVFTYEANGLNCTQLLNQPDPVKLITNGDNVVVDAIINAPAVNQ